MNKGDIVLITFPFTNLKGNKLRPAVVLVTTKLDVTVCFITTKTAWKEDTDVLVKPNSTNNLKKPSLIRIHKIATLDLQLVKGSIGRLTNSELLEMNDKLKVVLQLD